MFLRFAFCLLLIVSGIVSAAEISQTTKQEIYHLLEFINNSQCDFNRNGKWYSATDAAAHINKKYEYVLGKKLIDSAEDFISYAATKSSMSGKSYRVRCGDSPEISSADWLSGELDLYRDKNPK